MDTNARLSKFNLNVMTLFESTHTEVGNVCPIVIQKFNMCPSFQLSRFVVAASSWKSILFTEHIRYFGTHFQHSKINTYEDARMCVHSYLQSIRKFAEN